MNASAPAPPEAAKATRSPRAALALASAVVLLVGALARLGLLALGRAFLGAVEAAALIAMARDVVIVVAALSVSVAALRFARAKRLGYGAALPALGALALLFALGWKDTLRRPPYHDFHGVWTQGPSQSWTDNRPTLPHITYRHDRHGFRGADFDEEKSPGKLRIALVGDSFIYGLGVEEDQTLKARLDTLLARRGMADKVEVLNLGVPGANLATHVKMYAIAHETLGADVIVMGVFEDNDLSEWDVQDEINDLPRPSPFSLACFLLGERPAIVLADQLSRVFGDASTLAAFERIEQRLAAIRARDGAPPLIVLDYFTRRASIRDRFTSRPNVTFIATATGGIPAPEHHIPDDGHPSVRGNEVFAELVMERLLVTPAIAAIGAPAP
ncbi:MAG: SGNH/GDSL hydrolase family protein [Minicystis sp.]